MSFDYPTLKGCEYISANDAAYCGGEGTEAPIFHNRNDNE